MPEVHLRANSTHSLERKEKNTPKHADYIAAGYRGENTLTQANTHIFLFCLDIFIDPPESSRRRTTSIFPKRAASWRALPFSVYKKKKR